MQAKFAKPNHKSQQSTPKIAPSSPEIASDLKFTKSALRQYYCHIRDQLPSRAEKSRLICQKVQNLPEIVDASTILLYISFGSEVDTFALIKHFLGQKRLATPKIITQASPSAQTPKTTQAPQSTSVPSQHLNSSKTMRFHTLTSLSDLAPGPFGILEPQNTPEITDFTHAVAIIPALCYNLSGYRLGYGGGFYDKFLSQHPEIPTIGLCFSTCLTDQNFQAPHDIKIDQIITEDHDF